MGSYTDATSTHGFILRGHNNCKTTDFPGAAGSYANTINDAGQIVGEYSLTNPNVNTGIHGYL